MPEPTTAAVLAGIIASSAAQEFGSRIGEEIGDLVFGDEDANDLARIQDKLRLMDRKLDEILATARATYVLVLELPDVIERALDEQSRDEAWRSLKSGRDVFISLPEWRGGVGMDFIYRAYEAWRTVLELEGRTEEIIRFPLYAQYLLAMTKGAALDLVRSSLSAKANVVESSAVEAGKRLIELLTEAEAIIATEYIESGSVLDASPWLRWNRARDRTRRERTWVPGRGHQPNGPPNGFWVDHDVPDTAWNNVAREKSNRLAEIQGVLSTRVHRVQTAQFALAVLECYLRALEQYRSPAESIRTIAGNLPFPEDMAIER